MKFKKENLQHDIMRQGTSKDAFEFVSCWPSMSGHAV